MSDPVEEEPGITLSLERSPKRITTEAIDGASSEISASVYKFTDFEVYDSIAQALKRGVAVRLLLDADEAGKKKSLAGDAARMGAEIRLWVRDGAKLHAKFAIIDDTLALAGSYNWTTSGGGSNVELLMTFRESDTVGRFQSTFEELWEKGRPYGP